VEEYRPCPIFASFTLAFALQLRKKHGKTSVRVRKTSFRVRKTSGRLRKSSIRVRKTSVRLRKTSVRLRRNSVTVRKTSVRVHITKTPTHYNPPPPLTHTYTHTIQNNINPPQYKLKQTQYKIYPNEIVTI
jgi:hypothetical protein